MRHRLKIQLQLGEFVAHGRGAIDQANLWVVAQEPQMGCAPQLERPLEFVGPSIGGRGSPTLHCQSFLDELLAEHQKSGAAITFVTAHNADPSSGGYGRVIKTEEGIQIVEAKEFKGDLHALPNG